MRRFTISSAILSACDNLSVDVVFDCFRGPTSITSGSQVFFMSLKVIDILAYPFEYVRQISQHETKFQAEILDVGVPKRIHPRSLIIEAVAIAQELELPNLFHHDSLP